MESILARALEYTLKYWLKSFSRDQFRLQGRTVQLSNLDINGDALHASLGLPLALSVTTARVGKLEITLPAVSCVQTDPVVVQIDRLDLVLEEKSDGDNDWSLASAQSTASLTKGAGYGFADKIADGMTLEVRTVNLLLETHGGARRQGGSTWSSPMASITIRNLWLYTTNENWEVVNLKEARDFSNNKKFIYVFKKLEWDSLSIDLLPHPDMFADSGSSSSNGKNGRDDDGAKRVFFGGERLFEGISGQAHITVQRTEQNNPLGLEVQLHVTEAVIPALSEPGLRAFLRFMTGLYVCLNRGDVDPKAQQRTAEAAGRSLVSIIVDHIFLCVKDADFQLELLMQSLFFSRASVSDGETSKYLTQLMLSGLFLRDTFANPPCTLVQPSMLDATEEPLQIPAFGMNFSPPIYPFEDKQNKCIVGLPLISLYSLQITPSPAPPTFASQTVIECQPLMIILQEESCLRISSFLADGIVVNPGTVLPDFSVNSLQFSLKELDLAVPLDFTKYADFSSDGEHHSPACFSGARLHIANLYFLQSPSIRCKLLNLEKDPACFSFWDYQPVDASQKKWMAQAYQLTLSLETCNVSTEWAVSAKLPSGLWKCIEVHEACFEAAMVTPDGSPLLEVPPPGGVVRIGVACQGYSSNTSVEQLLFVLDIYAYFGRVSEKIKKVSKKNNDRGASNKKLVEKLPSDTAVSLAISNLRFVFLESNSLNVHGMPLVLFNGEDFFLKVSQLTLGGAFAMSTCLLWQNVCISCVDDDGVLRQKRGMGVPVEQGFVGLANGYPQMRPVFWIDNQSERHNFTVPFLDVSTNHVMPFEMQDMECHSLNVCVKISGVRLGGGMNYTEALLHRFGILGSDGGPGESLTEVLKNLSSGPLAKLFKPSSLVEIEDKTNGCLEEEDSMMFLDLGMPDDIDVSIELKNWLFALEGTEEKGEDWWHYNGGNSNREERYWHTTFHNLQMKAKSNCTDGTFKSGKQCRVGKHPLEFITVGVEGLQALKPQFENDVSKGGIQASKPDSTSRNMGTITDCGGVNIEAQLVLSDPDSAEKANWTLENIRFSVKQPIEAVVTKEELEHLAAICRSEMDSMGRVAAGVLRLLKLDESIGQASMDQLSNLGSESLDKIFMPDKLSRRSSFSSINCTPKTNAIVGSSAVNVNSAVALLETEVHESQEKCSALVSALSGADPTECLGDIKQLNEKLECMQALLTRIRTLL